MAKGTIFVPVSGDGYAPQTYTVPGAAILDLLAVSAVFDASGSGSDFLPAVQVLDSSGNVMATTVGDLVVAGDAAEVTFAPFLRKMSTAAPVATGVPFASIELTTPASPLAAGTYAPTIATLHTNAPGASVFSVDPTKPTFLQIAEPGVYQMTGVFNITGPITLAVGSVISVTLGTTGLFGGTNRVVLEHANTVATKRVQEMAGTTYEQFAVPDQARYIFAIGQSISNIGPLGWEIFRVSTDLVT